MQYTRKITNPNRKFENPKFFEKQTITNPNLNLRTRIENFADPKKSDMQQNRKIAELNQILRIQNIQKSKKIRIRNENQRIRKKLKTYSVRAGSHPYLIRFKLLWILITYIMRSFKTKEQGFCKLKKPSIWEPCGATERHSILRTARMAHGRPRTEEKVAILSRV